MLKIRVIPSLLIKDKGLVKTKRFKDPVYLGDPLNVINIFNKKMVDELILLDIDASKKSKKPDFELIRRITSICFSPLTYGGGITEVKDAEALFRAGVEKISINTSAIKKPGLITEMAKNFGSQSIIVSLNVSRNLLGKYTLVDNFIKKIDTKYNMIDFVKLCQDHGAGELFINDTDNDGMMKGYDYSLLKLISSSVSIPVIACGGAGSLEHFEQAVKYGGVSAVSAGSFFVFNGPHKAVLISYPSQNELRKYL